jgi:lycopene cyclase domain-containing protein
MDFLHKEYTLLALAGVVLAIAIDHFLGTRLIRRRVFWIFWVFMLALTTIVNGYLTWRPIVMYGERFFMRIRFITIPVEDYLFGFGLITLNLSLWEYFSSRDKAGESDEQNG